MEPIELPDGSNEPELSERDPSVAVQSPLGLALFGCLASFGLVYCVARPLVTRIGIGWIEFLIYAAIPLGVTYVILYCCGCLRGMARVGRTVLLILMSCLILGCDMVIMGIVVATLSIFAGMGRGHP